MLAKPGAPQREEMLTIQVKNTRLHLNGQNLRVAAKNGRDSKTPGPHLSVTHGKEAVARLTSSLPTREGTAQLDLQRLKSPRPDFETEGKRDNLSMRRPLRLAPLELPEEVREAQRQQIEFIQQEAKTPSCKLDGAVNEFCPTRLKAVREGVAKTTTCPSGFTESLKALQRKYSVRPQLIHSSPIEQNGDRHLEKVVCQGNPAPFCNKPAPPSLSRRAQAACGGELASQNPRMLQHETGKRQLRLRKAQRVEEDQLNTNTSCRGLCGDEEELSQGVRGKGQRPERGLRVPSCMLERASKKNQALQPLGNMEVSGRAIRKTAFRNLRDAAC